MKEVTFAWVVNCLVVPKFGTLILVSRSLPAVALLLMTTQATSSPRAYLLSHVSLKLPAQLVPDS
jgi:hypothetical protein